MGRKRRRRKVIAADFLSRISFDGYYHDQCLVQANEDGELNGFRPISNAVSHDLCSCTSNTDHVDVPLKAVSTIKEPLKSSSVSGYKGRIVSDKLQTLDAENREIHVSNSDCTAFWGQLLGPDFIRTTVCTVSGVSEQCTITVSSKQNQTNTELNVSAGSFPTPLELSSRGYKRVAICPVGHCTTRLAVFSVISHGRKHVQSISRSTVRTSKLPINAVKDVSNGHFSYAKQQQIASQQPIQRSQPQSHVQQSTSNLSSSAEPMLPAFVADPLRSLSSMRPMGDEELSFSTLLKPQVNMWLSSPCAWTHPNPGCVPRVVREPDVSGSSAGECLTVISNDASVCNFLKSGMLAAFSTTSNRSQICHLSTASLGPVPHWPHTGQTLSRPRNISGGSTSPLPSIAGYPGVPSTVVAYPDPLVYYLPSLLDDPDLLVATGKRVLKLPNYLTTVITYVRPSEQKRTVNREFQGRFPFIQLTLTKLRSIKSVMVQIVQRLSLDLWIAAHAHVLFEKLILRLLVNKSNRRLCASAVLIISAKLNDVKGTELSSLFQELENHFKISRRDMIHTELDVALNLEFCLIPNEQEIVVHYIRIYKNLDLAPPCLLTCYRNLSQSASLPSVTVPDRTST